MRRRTALCLVCRDVLILSNRSRITPGQRQASTTPAEIYNLPRVVLDLDAIDSKIVRKLEDIPKNEQPRGWRAKPPSITVQRNPGDAPGVSGSLKPEQPSNIPAKKRRPLRHSRTKSPLAIVRENGKDSWRYPAKPVFNVMAATASDLLSYALLGEPSASRTQNNSFRRRQLRSYGLLGLGSTQRKLQELVLQFPTDPQAEITQAGFIGNPEAIIEQHIRTHASFRELHRLATRLSSSLEGCRILAGSGNAIVHLIRRCRRSNNLSKATHHNRPQVSLSMALGLLTNLVLNIRSKGVNPEPDLCNAGLYYASRCGNIPAAKMYLEISQTNLYKPDWKVIRAMQGLQEAYVKQLDLSNPWLPWKGSDSSQAELLKFITSWRGKDQPQSSNPGRIRYPAFGIPATATYSTSHSDLYVTYLFGLGEMRLKTALETEWEALSVNLATTDYLLHAHIFAIAFILARDHKRAHELLDSVPQMSIARDPESTNCEILPSDLLPSMRTAFEKFITQHYSFHNLKASKTLEQIIKQSVHDILQPSKTDPAQALDMLEKLLVIDFPKYTPSRTLEIHWASTDEKNGLLAKLPGYITSEYFKPAG